MRRADLAGFVFLALALSTATGARTAPVSQGTPKQSLLAPTGYLRVGVYRGSPTSYLEPTGSVEAGGVGYELGRDLAYRIGVPFVPVVFPSNAMLLDALRAGRVDVTFTNMTRARSQFLAFSPSFMDVEKGFLAAPGVRLATTGDMNCRTIRVGVSRGSSSGEELTLLFPRMMIVSAPTLDEAGGMLERGEIDAFATNKAILYQLSGAVPGSRVLPGRWGLEHFAAAIPIERRAALPVLRSFIARAAADGLIARAIRRARLRGVVPRSSPPAPKQPACQPAEVSGKLPVFERSDPRRSGSSSTERNAMP